MKYFIKSKIKTLSEAKEVYRALIKANHPDLGGDTKIMSEINAEWQIFLATQNLDANKIEKEFSEFYTRNGWKGKNYSNKLFTKDIAVFVRNYVKHVYNDCRFSITCEHGTLYISLMETPTDVWNTDELFLNYSSSNIHIREQSLKDLIYYRESGYTQNYKNYGYIKAEYENMLDDIEAFVNSYRYSDCDGMIDYFRTNFYCFIYIGKWDKPVKIVPRKKKIGKWIVS